ncbi:TPA_asm: hypothetical protein G1Q02_25695 [Salmonella enterica subsp. enterica serovar Typhimurium]|nr:hypothetical protein [Salmonella enterica subsp. enterica serovar Typhimurium]
MTDQPFSDWSSGAEQYILPTKICGVNQLKIIKYNHLIASLLIFHNCHSMTPALKELQSESMVITTEILRALSSYRQHLNRFGVLELREREVIPVEYDIRLYTHLL